MELDALLDESYCCLGAWRCTLGEALGQFSVLLFIVLFFVVSVARGCFGCCGGHSETGTGHGQPPEQLATSDSAELREACIAFEIMFFVPVVMFLLCPLLGISSVKWAHPVQQSTVQAAGACLCFLCLALFLGMHLSMGKNWIGVPGVKRNHALVTWGVFRFARHPLYAAITWFSVGIALATLNWFLVLVWLPINLLFLNRISYEERDMFNTFGEEFRAYQRRVSALGPLLCCFFRHRASEPLLQP